MNLIHFRFVLALLVAAVFGAIPVESARAQSSSKAVVTVGAAGPAAPVTAGSTFEAKVTLQVRSGYHINAQKPSEDYLIGTDVKVTPPKGLTVVRTSYPRARMGKFSFSEEPLAVYEGTVPVDITFKTDAAAAAGSVTIPAKVTFQACNDDQCLPPATVDASVTVEIAVGVSPETEGKQTVTVTGLPPDAAVSLDGKSAGRASAQGRIVIRDVAAGRHRLSAEAEGFQAWEQDVEVVAETPMSVAATAVPDSNANANVSAATNAAVRPTPVPAPAANANSVAQPPADESPAWVLWILAVIIVAALAGIGYIAATRRGPSS